MAYEPGKALMEALQMSPMVRGELMGSQLGLALAGEERAIEQQRLGAKMFSQQEERAVLTTILNAKLQEMDIAMRGAIASSRGRATNKIPFDYLQATQDNKREAGKTMREIQNNLLLKGGNSNRQASALLHEAYTSAQKGDNNRAKALLAQIENNYKVPTVGNSFSIQNVVSGSGAHWEKEVAEVVNDEPAKTWVTIRAFGDKGTYGASIIEAAAHKAGRVSKQVKGPLYSLTFKTDMETGFFGTRTLDWYGWTQEYMPKYIFSILRELSDDLNDRKARGKILPEEIPILEALNGLRGQWNQAAAEYTEAILNPAIPKTQGIPGLVNEVFEKVGINVSDGGVKTQDLMNGVNTVMGYIEDDEAERRAVVTVARDNPDFAVDYARQRRLKLDVDEQLGLVYLSQLEDTQNEDAVRYGLTMEETGMRMVRDFWLKIKDGVEESIVNVFGEDSRNDISDIIDERVRNISDLAVKGDREKAREEVLNLADYLWSDAAPQGKVLQNFIEFFFWQGILESMNPADFESLNRYWILGAPKSGAGAILERIGMGKKE